MLVENKDKNTIQPFQVPFVLHNMTGTVAFSGFLCVTAWLFIDAVVFLYMNVDYYSHH